MTRDQFYGQAIAFLNHVKTTLDAADINLYNWTIDHLCYRVADHHNYQEMKKFLETHATRLCESPVNGRLIACYRLDKPILFETRVIDVIELPAPRSNRIEVTGFEHIEVVCRKPFDWIIATNQNASFDCSSVTKSFNPELKLKCDGFQVKFHTQSLASVITLEANSTVYNALENCGLLTKLKQYTPLIAGTYPLAIAIDQSDVDLIACTDDLTAFTSELRHLFSNYPGFSHKFCDVRGVSSTITQFICNGIPIEIFAQDCPSMEQTAFRHFQIEDRLLTLGGESFKALIVEQRQQGLKTEAAFAKVLQLTGDPYDAILMLEDLSDLQLLALY